MQGVDMGGNVPNMSQIGVADGHHPVSHNNGVPEQVAKKAKIDTYHLDLFGNFLERLKSTPDGDGTLLDNSLLVYGSPMGNGNLHNHKRVPLFVAGHAGGQLKGRLHVKAADGTPAANMYLALLHKLGLDDVSEFGDSTGALEL